MKPRETYTDKDGSVWVARTILEELKFLRVPAVVAVLLGAMIWIWLEGAMNIFRDMFAGLLVAGVLYVLRFCYLHPEVAQEEDDAQ